jgi:cysteinyl-tRNA synthetase
MNLDEFRREMTAYRQAVEKEGEALRNSCHSLDRLYALYEKFDTEERAMADQVIAEWALSEDENTRFDAQALIDEFKIRSALPALEKLVMRLAASKAVGAANELELVNRFIADLTRAKTSNSKS